MKHIVKVASLSTLPSTRPLIAMDGEGKLFVEGLPEFVDLGLSVKWRTRLIGATSIGGYGDYFAWGEIDKKSDYSWATYQHANGDYNKLTKYCPRDKSEYWAGEGNPDNLNQLVSSDDVAAKTNSAWRIPTQAECEELMALPNKWMNVNGVNGRVFCKANEPGAIKGDFSIMEAGLYLYDKNHPNPDSEYGSYNIYDDFDPIGLEYQTKDEVNAKLTTYYAENYGYEGTVDVDTMLFKNEEHTTPAIVVTDYTFGSFPQFNSSSMLFIPAAGCRLGSGINEVGSDCYLWSSSLILDDPSSAYYLRFNSGDINMSLTNRYFGYSVCPVLY